MELLIGAVVALLMQYIIKPIAKKFGGKTTGYLVIVGAFIVSFGYSVALHSGFITREILASAIEICALSVGTYEILLKRISPLYNTIIQLKEEAK